MHHELFFALLGHTGDIIEARTDGFFVRADVSFLSPPQRVEIDRLLRLGHAFAVLDRFVAHSRQLHSLYVRGLAQGIEAILREYTDAIVQLEAKVLTTRVVFPLPQMVYELEEFAELLPELLKVVAAVQAEESPTATRRVVSGAELLKLIHGMTESGFPRLRKRMRDLLRGCHRILFKQIVSWMAYGDIVDPYDEFFVKKLVQDDDMIDADDTVRDDTGESVESQIWQSRYGLEPRNAPPYFPPQAIESIFFIGRSVQILARSKGFGSEEAYRLIQTFAKVHTTDEFSRATLEHVVEEIRTEIARRLYQEIVIKTEFVEHFKLLKATFLLARGELFQSLMDQTSTLMATKPTHKSEEELHHGVWSQILRDFQVDENPLLKHFRLELPLQTFRFPPFPDSSGLVLFNMVQRDRYLEVHDSSQSCGGAWWPHRQVEHLPFTSTILVDLAPTRSDPLLMSTGGKIALLVTKDASFSVPHIDASSTAPHVTLFSARTSLDLVSFELDIHPTGSDGDGVGVVAHVIVQSPGQETEAQTSNAVVVPLDNNTLAVHIQYARMEMRESGSGKMTSPRTITIIVNGNKVLEVERDLTSVLGSGTLTNDHYVGLCVTPHIRTVEWRIDKYASRAVTTPGRLLSENYESLSARELWSYLTMRCDLHWPMHLLVSKSLLRSYGHLFQFSLRLKRVAHALERTWKFRIFQQTHKPKTKATEGDNTDHDDVPALRAAAVLRSRMSFVVRNIEQYFQVFVVESSFNKCLEDMDAAQDLDKVKRLHEQFVAQLVRRFYLHTHTMQGTIDQVLRCCWEFAEYAAYQESIGIGGGSLRADRITDLAQQFTDKFGLLFRTLRHPTMRDLLLLLDYNDFFSRVHTDPYSERNSVVGRDSRIAGTRAALSDAL